MAKKEEPIADSETGKIKVKAKKEQQPTGNEPKGNVTKVKAKMKKPAEDLSKETITKVDLNKPSKPEENETKEDNVNNEGVATESSNADATQEQKEVQPEAEAQETPDIEEIVEEKQSETSTVEEIKEEASELAEHVQEALVDAIQDDEPLPEAIQKLMNFMEDTGGDLTDYVTLNQDYSKLDNHTLLKEYYKSTKHHLSADEIDFVMEDTFAYDEEEDSDKEIKRKKLAMKEQVAQAQQHLESVKSKYYEDIKSGSKLTNEQQDAVNFYKESEKYQENQKRMHDVFTQQTNNVFNDNFKGFEYNIGEKKFRFNVKDAAGVKETQSDINNFIKKFLTKDNTMKDAAGYHKGLFTAMNPDQVANHFYEQGKADALKDSIAKSKNIDMNPRQSHGVVEAGGVKVRVLGDSSSDYKFKIKQK